MKHKHMDAQDAADVQAKEAATITALVRDGFSPASAITAVQTGDWSRLQHTGRLSVQLHSETGDDGNQDGSGPSGGEQGDDGNSA